MDIATIVGMIAAWTFLLYGVGTANLPYFWDTPSAIIVFGGTLSYALICSPLSDTMGLIGVYRNAFLHKDVPPTELIERIVGFAETARREGILALEQAVSEDDDPFLGNGVQLAVDGTEPDLIMDILETELQFIEERHKGAQSLINTLGDAAPAFGMIGTLLGLIIMLQNMDDPSQIGPGMAVAIITTLYGSLLCNLVFKPVATKLATYSGNELLLKRMIVEGIMAIQSGDNPRIVERKLSVFLSPKSRASVESKGAKEAA